MELTRAKRMNRQETRGVLKSLATAVERELGRASAPDCVTAVLIVILREDDKGQPAPAFTGGACLKGLASWERLVATSGEWLGGLRERLLAAREKH